MEGLLKIVINSDYKFIYNTTVNFCVYILFKFIYNKLIEFAIKNHFNNLESRQRERLK